MTEPSFADVYVHPLVVMSMADHSTREHVQKKNPNVCGVLLGQTGASANGLVASLLETFEMAFTETDGGLELDIATALEDLKLYREVYPDCDVLGWYATRSQLLPKFIAAHRQTYRFGTERPIFVLLNPAIAGDSKELPMQVYELPTDQFSALRFSVESDEAERITLEFCAKVVQEKQEGDVSEVATQFSQTAGAITSLNERISVIIKYLQDVKDGQAPTDQALLRQIRGLCNRLPAVNTDTFRHEYMMELNDTMLLTYLASINKCAATSRTVVQNFNTAFSNSGSGRVADMDSAFGGFGNLMNIF